MTETVTVASVTSEYTISIPNQSNKSSSRNRTALNFTRTLSPVNIYRCSAMCSGRRRPFSRPLTLSGGFIGASSSRISLMRSTR